MLVEDLSAGQIYLPGGPPFATPGIEGKHILNVNRNRIINIAN